MRGCLLLLLAAGCGTATLSARDAKVPLLLGPVPALGSPTSEVIDVGSRDSGGFGPQMESVSVGGAGSFAKEAQPGAVYRVDRLECAMSELFVLLAGHASAECRVTAKRLGP
jgi:hypothetical protein